MNKEELVSSGLKTAYDDFYKGKDDEWRMLSAKYKARNIVQVCGSGQFKKILEVGAGDGSILKYLDEWQFAPELYALEISESGVEQIVQRKLNTIKSVQVFDGYQIPFADNEFDLVILSHVLEHVEYERMLLREIRRVSKNAVIEVPIDYRYDVDKRMKHFLAYGHINMYTPSSLRFLVQTEGFEILSDKITIIEPEVTKFNTFVNQKKSRNFFSTLRIDLEFWVKVFLIKLGGRKRHEKFASAYTILLHKTKESEILT
ncbi:class I SAM-dependent methyltransferase [Daejeonella lutea]|uniref:Methyltransferase domain-containing protein n=1 Tax=Daejeonella lutea TaxID=572036 RepID=A0A1T5D557_9SPHI|nr:class I SAM-dependent methyltransferase [Daejeonella lutea]SKB66756.1 Methyltransferase domain-containing protein [Daejeonella lutea]